MGPVAMLRELGKGLTCLIFPPHCAACQEPAPGALCDSCRTALRVGGGELRALSELDGAACVGPHAGPLREMILGLKFHQRDTLAAPLAELLAVRLAEMQPGWQVDVVVPVPCHPRRRRERGLDHTALLAASLARRAGLPSDTGAVRRTRYTVPQVALHPDERRQNMDPDVFAASPARVQGRRILLIDDVATTGSTLGACAVTLRQAGAAAVFALTLSHGGGSSP